MPWRWFNLIGVSLYYSEFLCVLLLLVTEPFLCSVLIFVRRVLTCFPRFEVFRGWLHPPCAAQTSLSAVDLVHLTSFLPFQMFWGSEASFAAFGANGYGMRLKLRVFVLLGSCTSFRGFTRLSTTFAAFAGAHPDISSFHHLQSMPFASEIFPCLKMFHLLQFPASF